MQKSFILPLSLGTILLVLSSFISLEIIEPANKNAVRNETKPTNFTPVIDGKINEWPAELFTANTSVRCSYAIANDGNNLYIAVKVADRMQQMKLVNGGTEVWIDAKAKKKKNLGIKFPIGGEAMTMPNRNGGQQQPDKEAMKREMRNKMLNMELEGFKPEFNGVQSVYSVSQVKPVIDWNEKDELIYELAIPFAALPPEAAASLNEVTIGIIIKGLQMPSGFPGGGPGGGGMPAGGPPAGMRPPGGGGGMPDMSQIENLTKENSLWAKYTVLKN